MEYLAHKNLFSITYSLIVGVAVEAIVETELVLLDILRQIDFLSARKERSLVSWASGSLRR